ncbi:PTS system mannose/fructose/sorbose family transporter subunit IID [Thermoanaerobacter sp. YS13]|uniref:PTS system mannose/fructose/sorbose family transporter subunit IID n=1 Tax=Thermoanaerobacter sp. YS13 TaxID=1511746 RepID=UPI0009F624D4|nr:PTS system mannose/fructose/sorbose family transporter subunit IID [Thermoanaerobacter sp. YS13]
MGQITVLQAALIAAWVAVVESRIIGYTLSGFLRFTAVGTGFVVGLIMGNVPQAMVIAATIQLVYMGIIAPGGTTPSETVVATAVAVPVALASGMTPEQSIAVAVPVGLLAAYLVSFRFFINSLITHWVDRLAEELNDRGITFASVVLTTIITMVLFFPSVFVAVYYGAPLIDSFLKTIPQSVLHALTVVGGSLPALGIALTLAVIGRRELMVFYLLAYFASLILKPLNVNALIYAIFGGIAAYIYVILYYKNVFENNTNADYETKNSEDNDTRRKMDTTISNSDIKVTEKDLKSTWFRWWLTTEVPHSFERLQALAFQWSIMPVLRKLYKNNLNELKEAYKRHLVFFNTQGTWGGAPILGITLSLEEQRARAIAEGKEAPDPNIINATKVGLMGPLAGIGDSVEWSTIMYLLIAIALPWAKSGSAMGALFPLILFPVITYTYGYYFLRLGYRLGRESVNVLLGGEKLKALITGLSTLGLFMMGVLTSSYVSISTPLKWTISGKAFELQAILDKILPGMLPLLTVLLVYWYFTKKGLKVLKVLGWMVVIFFILGWIGIL